MVVDSVETHEKKLTMTIDEFIITLAIFAAKQNKIPPGLVNEYAQKVKGEFLPMAEYMYNYQQENAPDNKIELTQ